VPEKTSWESIDREAMNEGLQRQMLNGEKISFARMRFKPGVKVPRHQHENEQITMVTEGSMAMNFDDKTITMREGEMVLIPSNVPHSAEALEVCETLEIFSPRREDWITKNDHYLRGSK